MTSEKINNHEEVQKEDNNSFGLNQNIADFLKTYIDNPDPRYAIFIKGSWGCGKTHFINRWLKCNKQPEIDTPEEIVLSPIYVSLYGKTAVSQITEAINQKLHPLLYSKGAKVIKKFLRIAGKVALKTDLDLDGDGEENISISSNIDSLSLFDSKDDSVKGVRFLIFDDFERCQVDMKQLLGYINYFVEHCSCHVVLLGDESHIDKSIQPALLDFKEKTIGREFQLQPDVETAVDCFLKEDLPHLDWLIGQHDLIINVYRQTDCQNLRILRQCLYDFKVQVTQIDDQLIINGTSFMQFVLSSFIVVYCEYKSGQQVLLRDFKSNYYRGLMNNNEIKKKISGLQQKYEELNGTLGYNVLHPTNIEVIVRYIETGESVTDYISNNIQRMQTAATAIDLLDDFTSLSNEEFERLCNALTDELVNQGLSTEHLTGHAIALLAYFDKKSLRWMNQATVSLATKRILDDLNNVASMEELYTKCNSYIQGLDSCFADMKLSIVTQISNRIKKEKQRLETVLSHKMKDALSCLSDENVESLINLDDEQVPDGHSIYSLTPIFKDIDIEVFWPKLMGLSNKGKNTFNRFLDKHYKIKSQLASDFGYFADDKPFLVSLEQRLTTAFTTSVSVEHYVLNILHETIDKCILRSKGNIEPLA